MADAIEGLQHRRDALRLQLATVGQQDQLRGGRALLHLIAEREQRAHGAGNHPEHRLQFAAGLFDALADLLFVLGLEELPFADVLEIHAHEIEVFARRAGRGGQFLLGLGVGFGLALSAQRLVVFFVDMLVLERLGIVLGDELARRQDHCLIRFVAGLEPEFVGALTPVEHVCVAIGLRPVDQRIVVFARATAPAHRLWRAWVMYLCSGHTAGYCKSAAWGT